MILINLLVLVLITSWIYVEHHILILPIFYSTESVKAVNPFLERIPKHQYETFLDDYVNVVNDLKLVIDDAERNDKRFITPYKLMIAYARK